MRLIFHWCPLLDEYTSVNISQGNVSYKYIKESDTQEAPASNKQLPLPF